MDFDRQTNPLKFTGETIEPFTFYVILNFFEFHEKLVLCFRRNFVIIDSILPRHVRNSGLVVPGVRKHGKAVRGVDFIVSSEGNFCSPTDVIPSHEALSDGGVLRTFVVIVSLLVAGRNNDGTFSPIVHTRIQNVPRSYPVYTKEKFRGGITRPRCSPEGRWSSLAATVKEFGDKLEITAEALQPDSQHLGVGV